MNGHQPAASPNWPPILTARRVVAYAGRSLTSIDRAVAAGELKLLGRVGGRGERTFLRADVDAWLAGSTSEVTGSSPQPVRRRASPTGDALTRIRRTAAGGGK
jgi:hypothetical protein